MNYRTEGTSYETVLRDAKAGRIAGVYYLMGEESYYIDHVAQYLLDLLLPPEQRDFNLTTLYGPDATADDVIMAARAFPMGAERVVVWVKEAQSLNSPERFELYFRQPNPKAVVIFCHKNGTLDRRRKLYSLLQKHAVVMESRRLSDRQLPTFIASYLRRHQATIAPDAAQVLTESVGADLHRMAGELDKLLLSLPSTPGQGRQVTRDQVMQHIGLSRQYNVFELQEALIAHDVLRANRILSYFERNPKASPAVLTLSVLFKFFSNLMLAYYAPDRSEHALAQWLGQSDWQVRRNVLPGLRAFSGVKTMRIISALRRTDARCKGVDCPATPPDQLMRELVYFILH